MTPHLWPPIFSEKEVPRFPCPRCDTGSLGLQKGSPLLKEGDYAQQHRSGPDFEPDDQKYRFTAFLHCDNIQCGEIASMAGDLETVEYEDPRFGHGLLDVLRPAMIFPAPPIISFPAQTPDSVQAPLRIAFKLYWADPSSAANKVRSSVEALLTDRGVPRFNKPKPGKKRVPLALATRIDKYGQKMSGAANGNASPQKTLLDALRWVGNAGSHDGEAMDHRLLLHAFEIQEHVLEVVYGKRAQSLEKIAKALISSKGKKTA